MFSTPQKQGQESPRTNSPSPRDSSLSPRPRRRSSLSRHSSGSDLGTPDVIIEEFLDEGQEKGVWLFHMSIWLIEIVSDLIRTLNYSC